MPPVTAMRRSGVGHLSRAYKKTSPLLFLLPTRPVLVASFLSPQGFYQVHLSHLRASGDIFTVIVLPKLVFEPRKVASKFTHTHQGVHAPVCGVRVCLCAGRETCRVVISQVYFSHVRPTRVFEPRGMSVYLL